MVNIYIMLARFFHKVSKSFFFENITYTYFFNT